MTVRPRYDTFVKQHAFFPASVSKMLENIFKFLEDTADVVTDLGHGLPESHGRASHDLRQVEQFLCLTYAVLEACGETGELADKLKKVLRDESGRVSEKAKGEMLLEAGDATFGLTALAQLLDHDIDSVMRLNMAKLEDRHARGKQKGSGDHR